MDKSLIIVKIPVQYIQKSKGQKLDLFAYYPFYNGVFYEAIHWEIVDGVLSDAHKNNKSEKQKKIKHEKDEVLAKCFQESHEDGERKIYTFNKDAKEMCNFNGEWKPRSAISIARLLAGSNQNREAPLRINSECLFKNRKVAKLLDKPFKLDESKLEEKIIKKNTMELDAFIKDMESKKTNQKYLKWLVENYEKNNASCSIFTKLEEEEEGDFSRDLEFFKKIGGDTKIDIISKFEEEMGEEYNSYFESNNEYKRVKILQKITNKSIDEGEEAEVDGNFALTCFEVLNKKMLHLKEMSKIYDTTINYLIALCCISISTLATFIGIFFKDHHLTLILIAPIIFLVISIIILISVNFKISNIKSIDKKISGNLDVSLGIFDPKFKVNNYILNEAYWETRIQEIEVKAKLKKTEIWIIVSVFISIICAPVYVISILFKWSFKKTSSREGQNEFL